MSSPAREARIRALAKWPGATVHGRGPGWIRHQHPTDAGRFLLDALVGDVGMHYGPQADQEIDTAWTASAGAWDWEVTKNDFYSYVRDSVPVSYRYQDAATGHYVEITTSAVQWVNDEGQSANAASFTQVTPTITDDNIEWANIATGWNVRVQAQTARLAKFIDIDSLASLGAPSIGGTNVRLRLSFTLTKSANLGVFLDGVRWDEKNNTWIETSGDLEFRDLTSNLPVFWFNRPSAWDTDGNAAVVIQRTRRTGVNYYAEVDVPWAWLQSTSYPITIDPTVSIKTVAGADDAEDDSIGRTVNNTAQPRLQATSTPYTASRVTVTGPGSGDTVNTCSLSLYNSNASRKTLNFNTDFENADDPGQVATGGPGSNYVAALTVTGNAVSTNYVGTPSVYNATADLTTPAQAIIDRAGWASGQHVNVVCWNTGGDYQYFAYDGSSTNAPWFQMDYSTAGGDPEGSLIGGKLLRGGLLTHGVLVRG